MKPNVRESLGLNQPNFGRRLRNIALTGAALIGAVVAVSGLVAPVVRPYAKVVLVSTLDSTYVLQQSYTKRTLVDSLTHKQEVDSLFRMVKGVAESQARMESLTAKCLARAPRVCR